MASTPIHNNCFSFGLNVISESSQQRRCLPLRFTKSAKCFPVASVQVQKTEDEIFIWSLSICIILKTFSIEPSTKFFTKLLTDNVCWVIIVAHV